MRVQLTLLCAIHLCGIPLPAAENAKADKMRFMYNPSIFPIDEGAFLLMGKYDELNGPKYNWVWKIDTAGKRIWEKKVEGAGEFYVGARCGSGVIAVAQSSADPAVIKITADGGVAPVPSDASGSAITMVIPDKEYLVTGFITPNYETYHAKVMKIDGEGKTIWTKEYNHGESPEAHAAMLLPDGQALIVGTTGKTNKFGQGKTSGWLFVIDSTGKKLREAILPGGKIYLSGNVAAFKDKRIAVVYSISQLPPINAVPFDKMPSFDAAVTGLDLELRKQWELRLTG